jgi:hypothetical protein
MRTLDAGGDTPVMNDRGHGVLPVDKQARFRPRAALHPARPLAGSAWRCAEGRLLPCHGRGSVNRADRSLQTSAGDRLRVCVGPRAREMLDLGREQEPQFHRTADQRNPGSPGMRASHGICSALPRLASWTTCERLSHRPARAWIARERSSLKPGRGAFFIGLRPQGSDQTNTDSPCALALLTPG